MIQNMCLHARTNTHTHTHTSWHSDLKFFSGLGSTQRWHKKLTTGGKGNICMLQEA